MEKIKCFKCGKDVKKENSIYTEFYNNGEISGYHCVCNECREDDKKKRKNPDMLCYVCGKKVTKNRYGSNSYRNGEIFERLVICEECHEKKLKK